MRTGSGASSVGSELLSPWDGTPTVREIPVLESEVGAFGAFGAYGACAPAAVGSETTRPPDCPLLPRWDSSMEDSAIP